MRKELYKKIPVLILIVLLGQCQRREEKDSVGPSDPLPTQEMWNSTFLITRGGQRQAVLRYGHMQKFDQQEVFYFDQGVEVEFYTERGEHASTLTAQKGEYHESTENVFGMGNVVVVSDTATLKTERLRWDSRREKIISDTLITIMTKEEGTLHGIGFESDPDLKHWVIHKPWGESPQKVDIERLESELSAESADSTEG